MYGKLIDGNLIPAPNRLIIEGKTYYNPSVEMLVNAGYKEVVKTDCPQLEDEEITRYNLIYTESDDQIIEVWIEEDPDIIAQDNIVAEIAELKQKLSDTDYVACKIAEGAATREEYAVILENRAQWRNRINELELL